ncbi:MAG: hypothetical protein WKF31_06765 [Thermoleophilaceae bacterium]
MTAGTAALAKHPEHLEPAETGQHEVEHHEVGVALGRDPERLAPVAGRVGHVARSLEVARHHVGDGRLVVDHQHRGLGRACVHGRLVSSELS